MKQWMNDADLIQQAAYQSARDSFWAFRKLLHPKDKRGWFQREVAKELQQFYDDLSAGKRPKLVIQSPPQHGKSLQIIDFIAWLAGKNPELKTIYASFSDRLSVRANLRLQRYYDGPLYRKIFPDTIINKIGNTESGQALRNREILEYLNSDGYFRNTTVRGAITGETLDLGVIDDPIKGQEEAGSPTVRDRTWEWLTDDFMTRFSEQAGLLCILTRWHIDDPIGRLIKHYPDAKVLSYPAIATENESHRKKGEALFSELKSLEFLQERKRGMYSGHWEALYQQNPVPDEGSIFRAEWFNRFEFPPHKGLKIWSWDTAVKDGQANDFTVGALLNKIDDKIYLEKLIRRRMEYPEAKRAIIDAYNSDRTGAVLIEDKSSGQQIIQELKRGANIPIIGIKPINDKITRAKLATPVMQQGKFFIPANASWCADYVRELLNFPVDAHDDQVDATSQGILWLNSESKLTASSIYTAGKLGI